jgi:hypothetical protein
MVIARVALPVTDLRSKPIRGTLSYEKDPLQETQALYGDPVRVVEDAGDWVRVVVPDQKVFDAEEGWKGYPGFVQKKDLLFSDASPKFNRVVTKKWAELHGNYSLWVPMGTRLEVVREESSKLIVRLVDGSEAAIEAADTQFSGLGTLLCHLGDPYLWGGLCSFLPAADFRSGIDCSGLSYLYFRLKGIDLPRNARDQYKVAQSIPGSALAPGDLIFKHNLQKGYIDHVMIYFGDEKILESTMLSHSVRIVPIAARLGADVQNMGLEHIFDGNSYSFGRI